MTHEERLQMYAQQHADKWNEETPYSQMPPEDMTDEAKVSCKAAAEAIREFHQVLYPGGSTGDTEQYLIDNGYVPQPLMGQVTTHEWEKKDKWFAKCPHCRCLRITSTSGIIKYYPAEGTESTTEEPTCRQNPDGSES